LTIAEFDREKAWWHNREVNQFAWKLSVDELAARNYNLDCKNPHQETIEHGDPETLMNDYLAISQQLLQAQQALKAELVAALERAA
jgi:type I restriction enzyme M protein